MATIAAEPSLVVIGQQQGAVVDREAKSPPQLTRIKLYRALGAVANKVISDRSVEKIMGHLPEWEYLPKGYTGEKALFVGKLVVEPKVLAHLDKRTIPPRKGEITQHECVVTVEVEEVKGRDLQDILVMDANRFNRSKNKEPKKKLSKVEQRKIKYESAVWEYPHEGDLFTEREALVLERLSRFETCEDIGAYFGKSESTISRLLHSLRGRLATNTNFKADTNIDLLLLALSLNIAKADHIPSGETNKLTDGQRAFITKCFSSPYAERPDKANLISGSNKHTWSRIKDRLGVDYNFQAVLRAYKDGQITLPDTAGFNVVAT